MRNALGGIALGKEKIELGIDMPQDMNSSGAVRSVHRTGPERGGFAKITHDEAQRIVVAFVRCA